MMNFCSAVDQQARWSSAAALICSNLLNTTSTSPLANTFKNNHLWVDASTFSVSNRCIWLVETRKYAAFLPTSRSLQARKHFWSGLCSDFMSTCLSIQYILECQTMTGAMRLFDVAKRAVYTSPVDDQLVKGS